MTLNFNLVDTFMLFVMAGGLYGARKSGFVVGIFGLAGVILSTFFILHYYVLLGAFLADKLFLPVQVSEFTGFIILMICALAVFFLIREGWLIAFKVEAKSSLSKGLGIVFSLATNFFVCGLFFLALILLNNPYINQHIDTSTARNILRKTSVGVYSTCYKTFVHPFFPNELLNVKAAKLAETAP